MRCPTLYTLLLCTGLLVLLTTLLLLKGITFRGPRINDLAAFENDAMSHSPDSSFSLEEEASWLNSFSRFSSPSTKGSPRGAVIMKELGNATIRAELGQSTWRLIHTMASRYPKLPNADEQIAFRSFIHLLSRLYPCGQCAKHFQQLLKLHPPQTGSRDELSQWACKVHNIVNERLDKPQFNCSLVLETWKCGCAEDGETEEGAEEDDLSILTELTFGAATTTSSSSSSSTTPIVDPIDVSST